MNIVALKLVTGEDLLCDVSDETTEAFEVENPAVIVAQQTPDGRGVSVGLAPYLPYSQDKSLKLYKNAVVAAFTPDEKLSSEYNRIFGTGIVLANAGALNSLPKF